MSTPKRSTSTVIWGGVRAAAPPVPREHRSLGRRPWRARQGDRGYGSGDGVRVPPARIATARAAAPRGREDPGGVRGSRGQDPAVRPGDRRGNGGWPRGPRAARPRAPRILLAALGRAAHASGDRARERQARRPALTGRLVG